MYGRWRETLPNSSVWSQNRRWSARRTNAASVVQLGRRLYATLIKPAEPSLKNAKTVLLCPEGALNRLPWGALVVSVDRQGRPTYWIERVAIGAYAVGWRLSSGEKQCAQRQRGVAIAAVSQYSAAAGSAGVNSTAQLVRRSGRALGNLPAVRQEVAQLRRELSKLGVVIAQESNATPAIGRVRWHRTRGWCILPATRGRTM
jgi:CHAT domain-containing protein